MNSRLTGHEITRFSRSWVAPPMLAVMAAENPNLIWVDCEMTGLDLKKDVLVEIAVLVTDSQLNVLGEGVDLVIKATQGEG